MRRTWFMLKTFLLSIAPLTAVLAVPAGGFGALIGGLMAADSDGRVPTLIGAAIGAAIGVSALVVAISSFTAPLFAVLFAIHFSKTNSVEVRPRRTIRLNVPPAKAMLACREAALQIPGASISEAGTSIDRVAAGTPLTWESFGESIRFDVRSLLDPDRCEVIISSRPAFPTILVDYGVNERNVETAIAHLRKSGLIDDSQGTAFDARRGGGHVA